MSKLNNRGWHRAWTWDVPGRSASHSSGLTVRFDADAIGTHLVIDRSHEGHILQTLTVIEGATAAVRTLARLKREAVDGYDYAAKKHAYDTAKAQRAALVSRDV